MCLDLEQANPQPQPLLRLDASQPQRSKRRIIDGGSDHESLEERLRRERQRLSTGGSLTQFNWAWSDRNQARLLVPARGSLHVQDGILDGAESARCVHDKSLPGHTAAVDPQISPDGSMIAWTSEGELFVKSATATSEEPAIRLTYGAISTDDVCVSHGVADFVAQEEMDRYRGYWWHPDSTGILLSRVDESAVPLFRIMHHQESIEVAGSTATYEDHRYPFAGKENPSVRLGFVKIDRESVVGEESRQDSMQSVAEIAAHHWNSALWFDPPREAAEYLARVHWMPDGSVVSQWQNRAQTVSVLYRLDLQRGKGRTLLVDRSDVWINLHHMFRALPTPVHPDECRGVEANVPPMPNPLPEGSFSFIFASERTGYAHLYLYTFVPGINGEQAVLLRPISAGEWIVEHIVGVDMSKDVVYFTGTFDSVLERHLYALPITCRNLPTDDDQGSTSGDEAGGPNGMRRGLSKVMSAFGGGKSGKRSTQAMIQRKPVRLTVDPGMHSLVMDESCRYFVDTSSDLDRPTSAQVYEVPAETPNFAGNGNRATLHMVVTLFDGVLDDKSLAGLQLPTNGSHSVCYASLPAPEMISFPTSDGSETLYAALYRPDARVHGPGPYPLVCAVYGGPHVQRVNRSWAQCADMRAQRLRHLGFCVVKCDNRGSSRRGLAFESAIARRLGRLEVMDQVAAVRQLVVRGIADPTRVGVYGWSYGGYLSAMCLCRAPDVFHVAVAGAPVTSWDGYDTHYTERYMGLPADNPGGYRESAVFDHVPNMRGKLMIVHGLIDENVHFRHTARLINKLTAAGKDYDLLIFPDERHSPRRLRDRVYMEQRISEYFVRNLSSSATSAVDLVDSLSQGGLHGLRPVAGRL